MPTLRDAIREEERRAYAFQAREIGELGHGKRKRYYVYVDGIMIERRTREEIADVIIRAWDAGVHVGAPSLNREGLEDGDMGPPALARLMRY